VSAQFAIDVKRRLVVITFAGENTEEEIIGLGSKIESHPDFDPSFSEIIDCRAISTVGVSTAGVGRLARRKGIFDPASLHVIVAPRDHIFGIARMGQALADQTVPNIVVVRTMDEAYKILKLEKSGTE
jgi:hypothetical protein